MNLNEINGTQSPPELSLSIGNIKEREFINTNKGKIK